MYDTHLPEMQTVANPGSAGWAAGGAFAGRVIGGLPGLIVAAVTAKPAAEGETEPPSYLGGVLRWLGQIGGAAGGAALGAPDGLKGRAAIGAAIGGSIPIFGAPLAAVGAYIATNPRKQNPYEKNPMGTGAIVGLSLLGLAILGGGTYYGVKAIKKRQELKAAEKEGELPPAEAGNLDEWGWDLDRYEQWGAGPVTGQDGNDYAYVIYHDTTDDQYWVDFRGANDEGPEEPIGPFATSAEAETYVNSQLPAT